MNIVKFYANEISDLKKDLKTVDRFSIIEHPDCDWFGSQNNGNAFMVLNARDNIRSMNQLHELFDKEWKNRRPVLIKNLQNHFSSKLWTPQSFLEDFGDLEIDLINCRNHKIVPNIQLKYFWHGFEDEKNRMTDDKLRPLILKLKDWPTSNDFKNILPNRYDDLIVNAPISKYTSRESGLNLAANLPDFFGKPDLGPKLYIAYGSLTDLRSTDQIGTTNLHVDISDAFNIMMYVGNSRESYLDTSKSNTRKSVSKKLLNELKSMNDLISFEKIQYERYQNGERPGALWHLFHPNDANKIREFLDKYNIEVLGRKNPKKNRDPIHDQTNYIDKKMLVMLKQEYDVEVFTILQFVGDAIFIPAGSPHQVRNLNSCIKVAGDFVSPHGTHQCLLMTDQFRHLSDKHANHEDKLQIKNMIYHRVKDSVSILNNLQQQIS